MIIPYLEFAGNCEEALNFYQDLFHGKILFLQRFKDAHEMEITPAYGEKIMHAQLQIQDQILYLSDTFEGQSVSDGSRIFLNMSFDSKAEQKRVYEALKEGGRIEMELGQMFWGSIYASLVDRFGIPWGLDYLEGQ